MNTWPYIYKVIICWKEKREKKIIYPDFFLIDHSGTSYMDYAKFDSKTLQFDRQCKLLKFVDSIFIILHLSN